MVKRQLFFLRIVSSNTLTRKLLIYHMLLKSAKKGLITVFNGQTTYFLLKNGLMQLGKQKATYSANLI